MTKLAHSSCAQCRYRMDPCLYRVFGPCKFDDEVSGLNETTAEEKAGEAKQREITEQQLDQSQLVLQEDQMLAADFEKDWQEEMNKFL